MISTFDVAVVGGGTMGSAAAYFLAQRGLRVVVLEQFGIVHDYGSHSGETRIIRHAYHESPAYVPLVLRADELWQQLQEETGSQLLLRTGGIVLGRREDGAVAGAVEACVQHNLPYEELTALEVRQRWSQIVPSEDWSGCYDPQMGFLLVPHCISSYMRRAEELGAKIVTGARVMNYNWLPGQIEINTNQQTYCVKQMVMCAGSWTSKILAGLKLPLAVKRRTVGWFAVSDADNFKSPHFPIFLADTPAGLIYGFPIHGRQEIKIANHHSAGPLSDPDSTDRSIHADDFNDVQSFIGRHLPHVSKELFEGKVCLYTLTPDEHFVVDFHPVKSNILIAAGFSGHGFKFAPVIGEILADFCTVGVTKHPVGIFGIGRFRL